MRFLRVHDDLFADRRVGRVRAEKVSALAAREGLVVGLESRAHRGCRQRGEFAERANAERLEHVLHLGRDREEREWTRREKCRGATTRYAHDTGVIVTARLRRRS